MTNKILRIKNPLITPISPEPVNVPPDGDRFKLIALSPTQSCGILEILRGCCININVNESVYVQPYVCYIKVNSCSVWVKQRSG